jgi:PPOX class probable F420-dependent enzyme
VSSRQHAGCGFALDSSTGFVYFTIIHVDEQKRYVTRKGVMPTLADVVAMLKQQPYAVVSTIRPSGTVQSTLVNVGLYEDGVGLTTVGRSLKERNLKRNPACTVTIHHGPYWITVEGKARLRTWDDTDPDTMRRLLREIYVAAGGTHDDWETYDRVMREERRAAVVIVPERIYARRPR